MFDPKKLYIDEDKFFITVPVLKTDCINANKTVLSSAGFDTFNRDWDSSIIEPQITLSSSSLTEPKITLSSDGIFLTNSTGITTITAGDVYCNFPKICYNKHVGGLVLEHNNEVIMPKEEINKMFKEYL